MGLTRKYIVNKKTPEGLMPICLVVVATISGELLFPNIINYLCDCGVLKDEIVCFTPVDEPIRKNFSNYFSYPNVMAVSGTATVSTASPYGGLY